MPNYKEMYYNLYNQITDIINELHTIQFQAIQMEIEIIQAQSSGEEDETDS